MPNPYQPPLPTTDHPTLWRRFRRGLRRGLAEYRRGLARDGFSRRQHLGSWFQLFVASIFLLIFMINLFALLVSTFGVYFW